MIDIWIIQPPQDDRDFQIGFLVGSRDAEIHGDKPLEDIESCAILNWQRTKPAITLDVLRFCLVYVGGYTSYLNGLCENSK
jgi:hypothetical protein